MLPRHYILGPISSNRAFSDQLSPYQRGNIIRRTIGGTRSGLIETLLNVSRGTRRIALLRLCPI